MLNSKATTNLESLEWQSLNLLPSQFSNSSILKMSKIVLKHTQLIKVLMYQNYFLVLYRVSQKIFFIIFLSSNIAINLYSFCFYILVEKRK